MKANKIIQKLFKFEMITWFAWIHLTGSTLDMIMDRVWNLKNIYNNSWLSIRLCGPALLGLISEIFAMLLTRKVWIYLSVQFYSILVQDFRNDLKEAMEEYEIRKIKVAEIEHEEHKYAEDEIDKARKDLRKDKANLKAEKDEIENVWFQTIM